jgi:hypothetical protein
LRKYNQSIKLPATWNEKEKILEVEIPQELLKTEGE